MDVFGLRTRLVDDYSSYIQSFIQIRDDRIRHLVDSELASGLLWPDPLIQLNPSFEPGHRSDELVDEGVLHEECRRIFCINKESGVGHLAERHRGTRHCDLYQGLTVVNQKLGTPGGCPELGLPALGGFLWSDHAMPVLADCRIANADFLEAVRALAFTVDDNVLRAVDYKNLGAEELGSVYESLLELHPKINADAPTFELDVAAGHERKTTGSYYTPTSLITCLLDSALDPVLEEAAKKPTPKEAEAAILAMKVCDPACGSGHFLLAAAHRIAKRLAAVRTGDEEPAPEAYRQALRDVIGHCIFGVDINPMAVELCKINLWLESLEPGKPLSFLDHHIQCGNSLLGATPALLKLGVPAEAFTPIEGDEKKLCTEYKSRIATRVAGKRRSLPAAGSLGSEWAISPSVWPTWNNSTTTRSKAYALRKNAMLNWSPLLTTSPAVSGLTLGVPLLSGRRLRGSTTRSPSRFSAASSVTRTTAHRGCVPKSNGWLSSISSSSGT